MHRQWLGPHTHTLTHTHTARGFHTHSDTHKPIINIVVRSGDSVQSCGQLQLLGSNFQFNYSNTQTHTLAPAHTHTHTQSLVVTVTHTCPSADLSAFALKPKFYGLTRPKGDTSRLSHGARCVFVCVCIVRDTSELKSNGFVRDTLWVDDDDA